MVLVPLRFNLAIASVRKIAEDNAQRYPIGSTIALRDFYVDDLVTGADTPEEALAIKDEITRLMQEGKFELRKWASNEPSLRDNNSSSNQREFILSADKETEIAP